MIYNDTYSGTISINDTVVIKEFDEIPISEGLLEREIKWLTILKDFDRTPNIIKTYENVIEMTYVGERINKDNIPKDWESQIEYIVTKLKEFGCCHNDIKPEEILVKDDKLYIVDFGWSTGVGEEIPSGWSMGIGDEFAYGPHNFNDLYSLRKSIEHVLNE